MSELTLLKKQQADLLSYSSSRSRFIDCYIIHHFSVLFDSLLIIKSSRSSVPLNSIWSVMDTRFSQWVGQLTSSSILAPSSVHIFTCCSYHYIDSHCRGHLVCQSWVYSIVHMVSEQFSVRVFCDILTWFLSSAPKSSVVITDQSLL